MSNLNRKSIKHQVIESSDASGDEKKLQDYKHSSSKIKRYISDHKSISRASIPEVKELNELFNPSLKYIAVYKCYYCDSNDLIRKGKIFLTKDELYFKHSSMPFIDAHITIDEIESVNKISNHLNGIELVVSRVNKESYVFYKFRLPKAVVRNTIETLIKEKSSHQQLEPNSTSTAIKDRLSSQHIVTDSRTMDEPNENEQVELSATSIHISQEAIESVEYENFNIDEAAHSNNRSHKKVSFANLSSNESNQSCMPYQHFHETFHFKLSNFLILLTPILLILSFIMIFLNLSKLYEVEQQLRSL